MLQRSHMTWAGGSVSSSFIVSMRGVERRQKQVGAAMESRCPIMGAKQRQNSTIGLLLRPQNRASVVFWKDSAEILVTV